MSDSDDAERGWAAYDAARNRGRERQEAPRTPDRGHMSDAAKEGWAKYDSARGQNRSDD